MVGIGPGCLKLHIHIRKLGLYDLEFTDSLVELLSIIYISHCNIESVLHNTDRTGR